MHVASFTEIEEEFMERIGRMIWCNVATVDAQGRPRSRIMHPIWEGPVGWAATRPQTPKAKHVAAHPYASLAYIADVAKPVYIDCTVAWCDDLAEKERIWHLTAATPPPLGYDPAPIYKRFDDPGFGLLRLTPWRVALHVFPAAPQIWQPSPQQEPYV